MSIVPKTAVIAVLLLCQACGDAESRGKVEPIKLGIMSAFTGRDEALGQSEKYAMELAIAEINAAGGLLDARQVELVTADDAYMPAVGKQQAQRLVEQEKVAAFVGPVSSSVARAVLEVTVPAEVPNVSCCATSDTLNTAQGQNARDRYFFRTIPPDSFQAPVLAKAAVTCHACTRLAVFHRDDDYGNPFAEALADEFKKEGGEGVVYDAPYDPNAADYKPQIEAAAASEADCLVLIAFARDGARVRRDWDTYAHREIRWLAAEGILGSTFVPMLARPAQAEGFIVSAPVFEPESPENEAFRIAYMANYDKAPSAYNAQVYDGAALLMLAIARAASLDGRAIRTAMFEVSGPGPDRDHEVIVSPGTLGDGLAAISQGKDVNYQGASGPVDFEDFGNVRSSYELYRFGDDMRSERIGVVQPNKPLPCR